MKKSSQINLFKGIIVLSVIFIAFTVHAASKEGGIDSSGQLNQSTITETKNTEEAGINAGTDFSWEIFLPAFMVKAPPPKWGADSWVCCSISPYTFSITDDDVTKKATRNTCGEEAVWEGWIESTAGPKNFTWRTYGGCNGFSGSFSYTLENGKKYLFKAEWTGSTVIVSTSIGDKMERLDSKNAGNVYPFKTEVIKEFDSASIKTIVGNNLSPACR